MRRTAIPAIALSLLVVTGCASDARGDLVSANNPGTASSAPSDDEDSPDPMDAKDGTDLDACFDGTCEVKIEGTATIPLDEKFRIATFEVAVESGSVTITSIYTSGGKSIISLSGGGGGGTNNLNFTCPVIDGDTAILELIAQ